MAIVWLVWHYKAGAGSSLVEQIEFHSGSACGGPRSSVTGGRRLYAEQCPIGSGQTLYRRVFAA